MKLSLWPLFLLIFSAVSVAETCNPGDHFLTKKNKLFFGKKELSSEFSPAILNPSKNCKKLFPFCTLNALFAKNKKFVFFQDEPVKGADPASFKYVCDDIAYDKNKIYKGKKALFRGDTKSLQLDSKLGIYKTKTKVFNRQGKIIPGVDPDSVEGIYFKKQQTIDYIKDKNNVYHLWGVKLKLKAKDLKVYGLEYLGDKKNVYFRTRLITGADPESFRVIDPERHLAEDGNNKFREDKLRPKAK